MLNKISYKLILAVGGTTISIVTIFFYFIFESQHRTMIQLVEQNASQCSETIKSGTRYDMLLNQREHTYQIIEAISQEQAIEKIRIFNKLGEISYSTDKHEIHHMVDKKAESCFACHAEDAPLEKLSIPERTRIFASSNYQKSLGIINPIYNEPSCWQSDCHAHDKNQTVLGVLDVTMSLNEVERQIAANRRKILIFVISAIIAISLLLWILVHQLVGKPVEQLVKATRIVADGDLEYQIKKFKNDELGHLGQSFNDMTSKLVIAQRQLYQSDKLASLGRLTSGIAHEINNPLTGVLSYSSLLLKRDDFTAEVKEDLEVIVRETKRCREIVKRLLDFARQEPPKKTNVNINEVIGRAVSILTNQFNLKNISTQIRIADNLPALKADANQLQQVLINLLVNAADAINEKGGEIHVSVDNGKLNGRECVTIEVTDFGCGIPRENLTKIFDPFFTTKGQKGTGLGLAVVWGIVEKHDGKIEVQSEVGKGTTFTLRLPMNGNTTPLIEKKHE
jgi:two-component system NtrC family sensor kinase